MKKTTANARGTATKGQVALIKVHALIAANLVGPLLIDNPHFLRKLGYNPGIFEIAKRHGTRRGSELH